MSDHAAPLPDEDVLVVPKSWHRVLHPRRGGVAVPVKKIDKKAVAEAGELLEGARDAIERFLSHAGDDPDPDQSERDLAVRVRRHLDGRPDPAGAAALAELAMYVDEPSSGSEYWPKLRYQRPFAELWIADHGAAFAACALAELSLIEIRERGDRRTPQRSARGGHHVRSLAPDALRRVRAVLAGADEEEYDRAVRGLTDRRRTPGQRIIVSYLVPDRLDWVTQCCKSPPPSAWIKHWLSTTLYCSLGSTDHLALLKEPLDLGFGPWFGVVTTLVDGLGADALPVLLQQADGPNAYFGSSEEYRRFFETVSVVPSDEAFAVLLSRLGDDPAVLPELVAAMERFPVRAMRLMAPVAAGDSPEAERVAELLTDHVRTHPELSAAKLPASCRTVIEGMSAAVARVGQAEGETLPRPLVDALASGAGTASKKPATPEWADPALLPQVMMRDGDAALPDEAARGLVERLATPDLAPDDALLEAVKAACDPRSLAVFGWTIFERWRGKGMPSRHRWALPQLGATGDGETVRRLVRVILFWHAAGLYARALAGLDVLAAIGNDVALAHLFDLKDNGPGTGFRREASTRIHEFGERQVVTYQQLQDPVIPDFGLDADGGLSLDYGPRRFAVGFDQQLKPFVTDDAGRRLKTLPKPGAKDDPDLAKAAYGRFTDLKNGVRQVAAEQIRRLERAMLAGRTWSPEEFHTLYVRHPLLRHIGRLLVWTAAHDGGRPVPFRIAEDRTLADVHDDAFELGEGARIRLAHPVLLGDEADDWAEMFEDYEVTQPFPQLERVRHVLDERERASARLARFERAVVPARAVLKLTRGDWSRGDPVRNDWSWMFRSAFGGLYVMVDLSPGIKGGERVAELADQRVERVRIGDRPEKHRSGRRTGRVFGDLDPVMASEILADLTGLVEAS
ncbi:hypothetical protein GCM10010191_86370 [Actinomadura vinacea]|uniref:DUF4132 domain-containing protein n=1 Tax=Actinomadura vinacea TaxID=115336 RepID=A0ABN3KAL0_9ACTN